MRVYLIWSLLLFSVTATLAQTTIEGTIIEEDTGDPVGGVLVQIEETTFNAMSNDSGTFIISDNLPSGDQIISFARDGYENYLDIITIKKGKKAILPAITMELTSQERKRRKREAKEVNKELKNIEKAREAKLKDAMRDKEKKEKRLAKEKKKIEKRKKYEPEVQYVDDGPEVETEINEEPVAAKEEDPNAALRQKYAELLEVSVDNIENIALYEFIDEWMGTPYKYGGSNTDGIDCSYFMQYLFMKVYDHTLERTANTQFQGSMQAPHEAFDPKKGSANPEDWYLKEGDLFFFKGVSPDENLAGHVGVYLDNYKFAHSTSVRDQNGNPGVQISDIRDTYWFNKLGALGRRSGLKKGDN